MNTDDLSKILSFEISNAPKNRKLVTLILFGIEYAEHLGEGGVRIREIIKKVSKGNEELGISHDTQIKHGRTLSKYVQIK